MFIGFNAHITEQGVFSPYFKDFGQGLFDEQKGAVQTHLSSYALDEDILDATRIEEDWFPDIMGSHPNRVHEIS